MVARACHVTRETRFLKLLAAIWDKLYRSEVEEILFMFARPYIHRIDLNRLLNQLECSSLLNQSKLLAIPTQRAPSVAVDGWVIKTRSKILGFVSKKLNELI